MHLERIDLIVTVTTKSLLKLSGPTALSIATVWMPMAITFDATVERPSVLQLTSVARCARLTELANEAVRNADWTINSKTFASLRQRVTRWGNHNAPPSWQVVGQTTVPIQPFPDGHSTKIQHLKKSEIFQNYTEASMSNKGGNGESTLMRVRSSDFKSGNIWQNSNEIQLIKTRMPLILRISMNSETICL